MRKGSDVADARSGQRCVLWVDAVGGFLVCLTDQVTIGQAVPGTPVEIPVLGDLARRHAVMERRGEQYLVHPIGPTMLRGERLSEVGWLRNGDELVLGHGVRLQFRKPHPWSATAQLVLLSHHRTQPSCDGVLLMANTCLLGPQATDHVVCRRWSGQLVLARDVGADFRYKASEAVEIDGRLEGRTGILRKNSRLVGTDFALAIEEL